MLAIIGGTGLSRLAGLKPVGTKRVTTPWSDKRVAVELYRHGERAVAFLPRHGKDHAIPPHRINYRANIWALQMIGVNRIIAVSMVGGIHPQTGPGSFILPDQVIDYSYGRAATFFEENLEFVIHTDFTEPFSGDLRMELQAAFELANQAGRLNKQLLPEGVYACMQGPRLETAAEIRRLRKDGCDVVGMTGMPEAVLAAELKLEYAMLASSVNWAAGLGEGRILDADIVEQARENTGFALEVLKIFIERQQPPPPS